MSNELMDAVKSGLSELKTSLDERFNSVQDRLTDLEQKGERAAAPATQPNGATAGAIAVKALITEPQMKAAADATQQRKQVSQFAVRGTVDVSIKGVLVNIGNGGSDDAEYPTPAYRNPAITTPGLRPLRLLDVLPTRPIASDSHEYVQLGVTGEAEEQVQEGDEKAELDFEGELLTGHIATIAGHTTASKQVLADNAALGAQIDRVIQHKVLSRLEQRIINGVGGQGRIKGLLNQATSFVPTIGTTPADKIGESLVVQANAGYRPNLILLNPLDWFRLQITKTTTDEEYLFGSPTNPLPPALWNTTIVPTPSLAVGTGMTIDTSYTTVLDREQMSVLVSNTHKDYFTRNLVAILGELRAGLEVLDVAAVNKFSIA